MKIFITGATGFIGSRVANILSCMGHELTCLIRKHNEKSEYLAGLGAKLVMGDITDKASVLEGMKGCDGAIHLAAIYSFWIKNDRLWNEVNIEGTRNVMSSALEVKLSKIVHVSTAVIWGKPVDCPYNEKSIPGSLQFSKYSRSKFEADRIVWDLYRNQGLPAVVVYPGAVLGAGDPKPTGNYVSDFIMRRLPARVLSKSVLTWVHVNDVADAIVKALVKSDNIGEKYIVAKHQVSLSDYNKLISEVSGVPVPKLSMPVFMTQAGAFMLTALSRISGKEPLLGMSSDQIRIMKHGFRADGSKAERELGLVYSPLRKAIEEEVASLRGEAVRQKMTKDVLQE